MDDPRGEDAATGDGRLRTVQSRGAVESVDPRVVSRAAEMITVLAALVGVVLRLHSSSPVWLDEAISVNISGLPVPDLFAALRRDGSPPAYYLLLHAWIGVFGQSDLAARSLSSVLSLAALPVAYLVGAR